MPPSARFESCAGSESELLRFEVSAITSGSDAQGEVSVRLQDGEHTALGQGASTDILVASAKAYVNALNKLEYLKKMKKILRGGP